MAYISQLTIGGTTYDIKAKALATDILAANDAMIYKGTLPLNYSSTATNYYTPAANCGWTYKVSNVCSINGTYCEVGDMFICTKDGTAAATADNYGTIAANWTIVQTNLTSAVVAASGTSAGNLAKFTGATTIGNATVKYDKTTKVTVSGIPSTYTVSTTATAITGGATGTGTSGATEYTPAGTIASATDTATTPMYRPAGTVSKPTFSGSAATITSSVDYTPAGSVSVSGTANTAVNKFTASVSGTTLVLSAGSDIKPLTAASASFTGTKATLKPTASYTPGGSVSQPTFTGTGAKFTFTGTKASHSHSIPSLSVSGNYLKTTGVSTNATKAVEASVTNTSTNVSVS